MLKKFFVSIFTIIFVVGSVFAIFTTESYGTLTNRDFYTDKVAYVGYESLISHFAEFLEEEGVNGLTKEENEMILREGVREEEISDFLGTIYDDIYLVEAKDGEVFISISLRELFGNEEIAELPGEYEFGFEVDESVEGNVVEYFSKAFNNVVSVLWSILLFVLALIALVVLKPWYLILRAELRAIFISSLLLVVFSFLIFFSSGYRGDGFANIFFDIAARDVSGRILSYSIPVAILLLIGIIFTERYIKKIESDEGELAKKDK